MVVGCRREKAGSQPLNMNIGPSFLREVRITPRVDFCLFVWMGACVSGCVDELNLTYA